MRAFVLGGALLVMACGSNMKSGPDGPVGAGRSHELGACKVFPTATGSRDDYTYWNLDISGAPTDTLSQHYVDSMGASSGAMVHPDFGSDPTYGIPFDTVGGDAAKVAVDFDVADESDPGPYPFPPDAPVEAGSDGHVLVIDRDHCVLYELGNSVYDAGANRWSGYSGAVFDLKTGTPLRPEKWTSADASGGPIFVGLARYEEVAAGTIDHALRFTAATTQHGYIHPATHQASSDTNTDEPPMGLRLRLKASACPGLLSGAGSAHPQSKVIVQALCTYGMILADNGSNFYISGTTDPRWDDEDLSYLKTIPGADFEAIETGAVTRN
ncbi:MAG TPA: hypothetical protein VL463_28850 [Kofleriaceae bacterium]|nr:hypothetical protein [Kofleriaceae bacterium]